MIDPTTLLFLLKKLVGQLLLPPLLPMLLILAGLLLLKKLRRSALLLAWGGLIAAFVSSSPLTVRALLIPLETTPPITQEQLSQADAIIVLSGGKRSYAPEYGGETVNTATLERLRYGARLARQSGLPVLLTGGLPKDGQSEADLMAEALVNDFDIQPRWVESRSRDTLENAVYSAKLLNEAGLSRVVLVTHASHMPRAQSAFQAQGLQVIPAPTAWLANHDEQTGLPPLLPQANSAFAGWYATHEWLGRLFYALQR